MATAVESAQGNFASIMQTELGTTYLHYNSYKSVDLSNADLEKL